MFRRILFSLLGICFVMALAPSAASAQATRTWVSGVGDDANPCSRTAPCKTFAGAISKTATGGEINCLDPAGYGVVTITKSITIDCNYTHGGILSANSNGIVINGSNAVVILRGLAINGVNTTTGNGIRILTAATVIIDDVTIENFGGTGGTNGRGVAIETSTANVRVSIRNSRFYHNNDLSIHSIPPAGNVLLDVDNVDISGGGTTAIQLRQNTVAAINRTSVTNHAVGAAITLELSSTSAMISNSLFANNAFGVFNGNLGGAPTSRLYGTVITGNTTQGILINGGSVISLGNNAIRGNVGNEAPSSTIGTQ